MARNFVSFLLSLVRWSHDKRHIFSQILFLEMLLICPKFITLGLDSLFCSSGYIVRYWLELVYLGSCVVLLYSHVTGQITTVLPILYMEGEITTQGLVLKISLPIFIPSSTYTIDHLERMMSGDCLVKWIDIFLSNHARNCSIGFMIYNQN